MSDSSIKSGLATSHGSGATELDLVCIGRAGVDFYAKQIGSRLEDVASFSKYIGGSSTNIAACSSRMGLSTALITRVGNEHMGQFIREQLQREGVNTSQVITDDARLTATVVLGIKDQDTFPLIFYRENCADMALEVSDINGDFIAAAKCLLITGTHFSTDKVYETCTHALKLARAAGVKTALDIDYRPVLWGLTSRGDGETRFVKNQDVTSHLQSILPLFDLIVGTEEEVHIAGGSTDTLQALVNIRQCSNAVLVLKRGPYGASVYPDDIPDDLDKGITVAGVTVDVLNVLGAGDAFISGFLRGWLNEEGYEQSLRYANACGALVVSRHGCTPAMPTREELDYYLDNAAQIPRPDQHNELNYLHRVTTRFKEWPELMVHAFDHRSQFEQMALDAGVSAERIFRLKELLFDATLKLTEGSDFQGTGIICDDQYGQKVLNQATGSDLWIARPVEQAGSRPLAFINNKSIGSTLESWPLEHVVKCLVFYSAADDAELLQAQDEKILELYDACCQSGHELLLEIIPPLEALPPGVSINMSVEHIYDLGIRPDWWKLPALSVKEAGTAADIIKRRSPHCRGIVVLGKDAPLDELLDSFKAMATIDLVKGFAVGRTIFSEAAKDWLAGKTNDDAFVAAVSSRYRQVCETWAVAKKQ